MSLPAQVPASVSIYKHTGTWLGLVTVLFITFNAWRAFSNPVGFAAYYGTALSASGEVSFVYVYGIRALALGVLGGWLLLTRRLDALAILAFSAVVMALGDAVLTHQSGAAVGTVIRHLVVAGFLATTGVLLRGVAQRARTA